MAINNNDIKLFESQRLSNEVDGEGRVIGREVIDGNVNNLFQDISRIERAVGDVALRKAFVGISTDTYEIIRMKYPGGDVNVVIALNDGTKLLEALKNAGDGLMQLDDITLPDDLLWINEFDWNPVA